MKIAVISDIHGNMEALNSVLEDIKSESCEKVFCLGDLALAGPEPSLTIEKIKSLFKEMDFTLIQGNTDEKLARYSQEFFDKLKTINPVMANAYLYDFNDISDENKDFLFNIEKTKEIVISNIKILLVHGSPRSNDENISPDLSIQVVEEMLKRVTADIIFCGHTHIPCGYQTNTNQTVVNVGSVGRPFSDEPKSCYAVLEIDEKKSNFMVRHKFVSYDYKTAARKMRARSFEGADILAKTIECTN